MSGIYAGAVQVSVLMIMSLTVVKAVFHLILSVYMYMYSVYIYIFREKYLLSINQVTPIDARLFLDQTTQC